MSANKSSTSILLDLAWNELDNKNQDFIYAKDFPSLVNIVDDFINRSTKDGLKHSLLSDTGESVIKTFAKEKEFFKIYKDEFKEIFYGLIGKSFKELVEDAVNFGEMELKVLNGSPKILKKNVKRTFDEGSENESVNVSETENKEAGNFNVSHHSSTDDYNSYVDNAQTNIYKDDYSNYDSVLKIRENGNVLDSPLKGHRKPQDMDNDMVKIRRDLKFKDSIIIEKDREIIELTKKVGDLRDKYNFIQREFSFYKKRGEAIKPEDHSQNENNDQIQINDITKHEFIIDEMNRKIHEQMVIINALKEELQNDNLSSNLTYGYLYTNMKKKLSNNYAYSPLFYFTIFILSIIFIVGSWNYLFLAVNNDDNGMYNSYKNQYLDSFDVRWWEKNVLLRGIMTWILGELTDIYGSTDPYFTTATSSNAYDNLFNQ